MRAALCPFSPMRKEGPNQSPVRAVMSLASASFASWLAIRRDSLLQTKQPTASIVTSVTADSAITQHLAVVGQGVTLGAA